MSQLIRIMKTEYAVIKEDEIDEKARRVLRHAGQILKDGGLVAFPTETVYGLGGDALNPESSKKIYAAKGRPSDNPLIVHICRMEDLKAIVREVPEAAQKLAEAFWPGPLTLIFYKSDLVPKETTGGLDTVAVRFPSNRIAHALIEAEGGYIAAPSANTSGRPSPTVAKYCREDLDGKIEMIIDGGQVCIGLESTIIDCTGEVPVILRPGYITREMASKVVGQVEVDHTILSADSKEPPKAPGMKYRHYAPKGQLTIVEGRPEAVISYINKEVEGSRARGLKTGVICTDETKGQYRADVVLSAGSREDEEEVAKELFLILREFDDAQVSMIFSEAFEKAGIGQAIMNRLMKAAGHHIIKVS